MSSAKEKIAKKRAGLNEIINSKFSYPGKQNNARIYFAELSLMESVLENYDNVEVLTRAQYDKQKVTSSLDATAKYNGQYCKAQKLYNSSNECKWIVYMTPLTKL